MPSTQLALVVRTFRHFRVKGLSLKNEHPLSWAQVGTRLHAVYGGAHRR